MSIKEEIKMLLAQQAVTMTELAKQLSTKDSIVTVQSISKKLSKKTIKFEEVRKILDILGYEIEYKRKGNHPIADTFKNNLNSKADTPAPISLISAQEAQTR